MSTVNGGVLEFDQETRKRKVGDAENSSRRRSRVSINRVFLCLSFADNLITR